MAQIRGYELFERIGKGGFGEVYRAYQPILQRDVAIKMISPQHANQPDFVRNFETEAQLVARLEHPHIVPLFDYWQDSDGAFLVMRLIRGGSLSHILKNGKWNVEQTLRLFDQISSALAFAHRSNVIHRDIKPDNILLDDDNAYLTDFGIAQIIGKEGANTSISGSLPYMAPEQLLGHNPLPQSDIYALALLIYEILVGEHVFLGASFADLIQKHLHEPIPNIHDKLPDVPPALHSVLQRATQKDPFERYPHVRDFYKAVQSVFSPHRSEVVIDESELINPYKGLRPFEQADANDFFGREVLIAQLGARLTEDVAHANFLAVVGASGSGKSSVVKAGLIPALRKDLLTDSSKWVMVEMMPSAHPLYNLAGALEGLTLLPLDNLLSLLKQFPDGLVSIAERIKNLLNAELFIFIDQFEEVFTLCDDESERVQFLELITTAIQSPHFPIRLVVTLRADFYDRPLAYRNIGELFQQRSHVVLPMNAEEIERAIRLPAQRVGAIIDQNLIVQLVTDVQDEIGALPLLQYALTELFDRREGRHLTLSTYQASGGVTGALARRADDVWQELPVDQRKVAQQLFLRLVTLGEGNEDTRRRAKRSELLSLSADKGVVNGVLDSFGKYRLLTFDYEAGTREPLVEVAHEALIRTWERLREWLATSRNDIRQQRQLATYAQEWQQQGEKIDYLLTGARLTQFDEWERLTPIALTPSEHHYLSASRAEQARRELLEEQRQIRERQLERRSTRVLQVFVGVLLVAVVVAVGLSLFAFSNQREAQSARETSEANLILANDARATSEAENIRATSLLLSNEARQQSQIDTQLAALLAIQSLQLQPSDTGDAMLQQITQNLLILRHYPSTPDVVPRISPDGEYIARGNAQNQIEIVALNAEAPPDTETIVHVLDIPDSRLLAWSPDNTLLASVTADFEVQVWDIANQTEKTRFNLDSAQLPDALFFTPDNAYLLAQFADSAEYWQLDLATRLDNMDDLRPMNPPFSPDSQWALLYNPATNMQFTRNLQTGETIQRDFGNMRGVYNHSQSLLYVLQSDGQHILAFNTNTWQQSADLTLEFSAPNSIFAISQDERFIAIAERDGLVRLVDLTSGRSPRSFFGHQAIITDIQFAVKNNASNPQDVGRTLLTQDLTGMMMMWDFNLGREINAYSGFQNPTAHYIQNGDYIAVVDGTDAFLLEARVGIRNSSARFGQGQVSNILLTQLLADDTLAVSLTSRSGYIWNPQIFSVVDTLYNSNEQMQNQPNQPQGQNQQPNNPNSQPNTPNQQPPPPSPADLSYNGFVTADGQEVWYTDSRTIHIYDVATQNKTMFRLTRGTVYANIAVSADKQVIYAITTDGTLEIWDFASQARQNSLPIFDNLISDTPPQFRFLFTDDGRYVLIFARFIHPQVIVLDTESQEQTSLACASETDNVNDVAMDADNQVYVLCSQQLFRQVIGADERVMVLDNLNGDYDALAISASGVLMALGTNLGNIDIFEINNPPQKIRTLFNIHQGFVRQVRFFADDTRLLSGGGDNFVAITPVTLDDLVAFACERIFRNYTPEELATFQIDESKRACVDE